MFCVHSNNTSIELRRVGEYEQMKNEIIGVAKTETTVLNHIDPNTGTRSGRTITVMDQTAHEKEVEA